MRSNLGELMYWFARGLAEAGSLSSLPPTGKKRRGRKASTVAPSPQIPFSNFINKEEPEEVTLQTLMQMEQAVKTDQTLRPKSPPDRENLDPEFRYPDENTYSPDRETDEEGRNTTLPWLGTK